MSFYSGIFTKTMGNEGGFSNNPADRGGMTYRGIARRYHPSWRGWPVIDKLLAAGGHLDQLFESLDPAVREFYKIEFWDRCNCEALSEEGIAYKLFDSAVNLGVTVACKYFQETLNVLNRNGKLYPDIATDGKIGPNTLRILTACTQQRGAKNFLLAFHFRQGAHYWDLLLRDPAQEEFAMGWFKRAEEGS